MTISLDYIRKKLGWCPNAQTMRTSPMVLPTPPVDINPAQPEGGAGGPGRIDRGITLAIGSIRVLFRNRRLLWFSLLIGLVITFSLVTSLYLQYISGTMPFAGTDLWPGTAPVLIAQGSVPWIALTFVTVLISTFLTYYLLAALIASVSFILSGQAATIRYGLAHAGNYLRPLGTWAVVWAIIGTVSTFIISSSRTTNGPTGNLGITFLAIVLTMVLYVITMFVVPLIVLGNGSLINSVRESASLFRKIWREILVCFIILFLVVFVILVISLVPIIAIGFSSGSASAPGVIAGGYMLVMFILIFIGSTVAGIAITGLYTYGKTGTLPTMFRGKQEKPGHV
jgi:amino acid transporter